MEWTNSDTAIREHHVSLEIGGRVEIAVRKNSTVERRTKECQETASEIIDEMMQEADFREIEKHEKYHK